MSNSMKKEQAEQTAEPKKKSADELALEARIAEEQRMLAEKKTSKKPEKSAKAEPKKEEKDISGKVSEKKQLTNFQKEFDYHKFLEEQQVKLDYAALFSYLGNLKTAEYRYDSGDESAASAVFRKDETIAWEKVKFYVEESKMNQMLGLNRNFEVNEEREAYKWWKAFNVWQAYRLFETSLT